MGGNITGTVVNNYKCNNFSLMQLLQYQKTLKVEYLFYTVKFNDINGNKFALGCAIFIATLWGIAVAKW